MSEQYAGSGDPRMRRHYPEGQDPTLWPGYVPGPVAQPGLPDYTYEQLRQHEELYCTYENCQMCVLKVDFPGAFQGSQEHDSTFHGQTYAHQGDDLSAGWQYGSSSESIVNGDAFQLPSSAVPDHQEDTRLFEQYMSLPEGDCEPQPLHLDFARMPHMRDQYQEHNQIEDSDGSDLRAPQQKSAHVPCQQQFTSSSMGTDSIQSNNWNSEQIRPFQPQYSSPLIDTPTSNTGFGFFGSLRNNGFAAQHGQGNQASGDSSLYSYSGHAAQARERYAMSRSHTWPKSDASDLQQELGHQQSLTQEQINHLMEFESQPGPSTSHARRWIPQTPQQDQGQTSPITPARRSRSTQIGSKPCEEPGCTRNFRPRDPTDIYCRRHQQKFERNNAAEPTFTLDPSIDSYRAAYPYVYPVHPALDIPNDDVHLLPENHWIVRFLAAASKPYNNQTLTQEFHARQQKVYNGKKFKNRDVNVRMRLLYRAAYHFHLGGPAVYPLGGDNEGYGAADKTLTFSQRMEEIIGILEVDKRVCMDVIEGRGVTALVGNPEKYERRKVQNKESNARKQLKQQLGDQVQAGLEGKGKGKARAEEEEESELDSEDDDEDDGDDGEALGDEHEAGPNLGALPAGRKRKGRYEDDPDFDSNAAMRVPAGGQSGRQTRSRRAASKRRRISGEDTNDQDLEAAQTGGEPTYAGAWNGQVAYFGDEELYPPNKGRY